MTNEIKIVTLDEAENADMMACVRLDGKLIFPDNEVGVCSKCGEPIQFRPNAPKAPIKVCLPCAMPDIHRETKNNRLSLQITAKTAKEVMDYYRRKSTN